MVLQSDVLDLQAGLALVGDLSQIGSPARIYNEITNVSAANSTGRTSFSLTLPPELEFARSGTPGWTCSATGPAVSCFNDGLVIGPQVLVAPIVEITVRGILAGPTWINLAIANAADANPANNMASLRVDSTFFMDPADLTISQRLSKPTVMPGESIELTASIVNHGPDPAASMVSFHVLPADVALLRAAASAGACSGDRLVTCVIGRVPAGESRTVALTMRADGPGAFSVVSSVASPEDDPNLADNQVASVFTVGNATPPTSSRPPFGFLDLPAEGAEVAGAFAVGGWAIDDVGVAAVRIYRDAVAPETPNTLVYLGEGLRIRGARPDVERTFQGMPESDSAGWGMLVLSNLLPNRGSGPFRIHAVAVDSHGQATLLGSRLVVGRNDRSTKPFGTIDTPAQGETVSASRYLNFGWVLTPQPKRIPQDGSTITVLVDGTPVGPVLYGHRREDIASLFPDFANAESAIGFRELDFSRLSSGLHTISWVATDSGGETEGLGSRYFRVGPVPGRIGPATAGSHPPAPQLPQESLTIAQREMSPVAIDLRALTPGACDAAVFSGIDVSAAAAKPLPIGSSLDPASGMFRWQPGPGFVGRYRLAFTRRGCGDERVIAADVILFQADQRR